MNYRRISRFGCLLCICFGATAPMAQEISISDRFLSSVDSNNVAFISTVASEWGDDATAMYLISSQIGACKSGNCNAAYWNNPVVSNATACMLSTLQEYVSEEEYESTDSKALYWNVTADESILAMITEIGKLCSEWASGTQVRVETKESTGLTISAMHYFIGIVIGATVDQTIARPGVAVLNTALLHGGAICALDRIKKNEDFIYLTQVGRTDQSKFPEDSETISEFVTFIQETVPACLNFDAIHETVVLKYFAPTWEKALCDLAMSDDEKSRDPVRALNASMNSVKFLPQIETFIDNYTNEEYKLQLTSMLTCNGKTLTRNQ